MSESRNKMCPECGKEMEKGYFLGPRGIYWNTEVPEYYMKRYRTFGESFGISSDRKLYFLKTRSPNLPAFRCRTCEIFKLIKES